MTPRRPRSDDGFILLESVVAISLITVVLAALGTFTLNTLANTSALRATQSAAQLATSSMAALAAIPATDLVTGRDEASVANQLAAAPASVRTSLAVLNQAVDETALPGAGATATISTSAVPQVLNNVAFSVNTYLENCVIVAGSTACVANGVGIDHLRAVVAVTWTGRGCRTSSCAFVTTTLVNQNEDPVFNLNTANPPADPAVQPPGNQVSTLGARVSVQLDVRANTGVPPHTWQVTSGTLPTGLTLSASGVVSGVPTALVTSTPLTVTVSDAFGRTGSGSFTWTVVPAPTVTKPSAQTSTRGQASGNLAVSYTCPNAPCAFTLNNAPPGLTINATTGVISGVPTTLGVYADVTVTVTDADDVSAVTTPSFTWTVIPEPTVETPAILRSTIGTVDSIPVDYTCPTLNCTLLLTGTAPGIGLSATTPRNTNNTTTTLAVTGPTGTVYLAGAVQTWAVITGTSQPYAPTVRITDGSGANTTSEAGDWTIYSKPTIGAIGSRNVTVGAPKNIPVAYTCPNVTCTLTLTGTVPGLGLSTVDGATADNTTTTLTVANPTGTIYVNGRVASSAVPTGTSKAYALTLTIQDSDTVTAVTTGTWTARTAPKITDPGSQAIEPNQTLSLQMVAACANGGCTWEVERQVGSDPMWSISSTGLITNSNTPAGTYTLRVTVTDSDGITDTVLVPLRVTTFSMPIPTQVTSRPSSGTKIVTLDVSALVSPAADGYRFTLSNAPSWLKIDTTTGLLTATLTTSSTTDTSIRVTVISLASSTSTHATNFRWTIN